MVTSPEAVEPTVPSQPRRVLVVEDDPHLRRAVVWHLRTRGYAIIEAPDGGAAMERFRESPGELDVILLDLMLPVLAGMEVARQVLSERADLPIVACSAALDDATVDRLRSLGVRNFLPKPFSADDLHAILTRAIQAR